MMKTVSREDLEGQIDELKAQLTGDMFQDMEIKDKIHNIEMKLKGVRPADSTVECIGCGS
jgi:ribosomal protein L29